MTAHCQGTAHPSRRGRWLAAAIAIPGLAEQLVLDGIWRTAAGGQAPAGLPGPSPTTLRLKREAAAVAALRWLHGRHDACGGRRGGGGAELRGYTAVPYEPAPPPAPRAGAAAADPVREPLRLPCALLATFLLLCVS